MARRVFLDLLVGCSLGLAEHQANTCQSGDSNEAACNVCFHVMIYFWLNGEPFCSKGVSCLIRNGGRGEGSVFPHGWCSLRLWQWQSEDGL